MKTKAFVEALILLLIFSLGIILFTTPKHIKLYNQDYLSNTIILNLSNVKINSLDELNNNIDKFNHLKEVDLGNNAFKITDYNHIVRNNPNIIFKMKKIINIYGKDFEEDVTSIDLNNVKIDDSLENYIELFPNLKEIDLQNQDFTLEKELYLTNKFPNIVFKWKVPVLNKNVSYNIEKLNLDKEVVSDVDEFASSLSLLKNLKYLDMGTSNLTNEELGTLREKLPNVKIAWVMKFGVWSMRTDDVAFSVLISNFPYKRLTSKDIEFLKYCTDLQALDLGHQRITDLNVIADNVPNLRILILADNKITDISPLTKLKHLHYLELFINNITDFSPLKDMKELVDLNVCYNRVVDIEPFKNLPKLERLWIGGCGLNHTKLLELRKSYENATINVAGPGSTGAGWRTHERYYSMIDMYHKKNYISEEFTKYD